MRRERKREATSRAIRRRRSASDSLACQTAECARARLRLSFVWPPHARPPLFRLCYRRRRHCHRRRRRSRRRRRRRRRRSRRRRRRRRRRSRRRRHARVKTIIG